jgi:hypothetical protein
MANIVPCTLVVRGNVEDIEKFWNDIDLEKGILWSILPCPQELLDLKSVPSEDVAYDVFFGDGTDDLGCHVLEYPWVIEKGITSLDELKQFLQHEVPGIFEHCLVLKSNVEKYGSKTSYDWAVDNYGDKWGDNHTELVSKSPVQLIFKFESAWGVPCIGFCRVAELYPELEFVLTHQNLSFGVQGVIVWDGGEPVDHGEFDYCPEFEDEDVLVV